jgi:hypothetical protein
MLNQLQPIWTKHRPRFGRAFSPYPWRT